MFDVCVLSPYSGIVEHRCKRFNRFEEVGYVELQLRRMFGVSPASRRSRLWISEKTAVPRFRQLLARSRMLNDCGGREGNRGSSVALAKCRRLRRLGGVGKETGDTYLSILAHAQRLCPS